LFGAVHAFAYFDAEIYKLRPLLPTWAHVPLSVHVPI